MADYNSDRTGSNIDLTLDKVDALDAKVQPIATGVNVTGGADLSGTVNVGSQNIIFDNYNDVGARFRRNGTYGPVISLGRQAVSDGTTLNYPANGQLGISTNGSERMRIDSGGRVFIGTTTGGYSGNDLTVGSTSDNQNGLSIQTSTTGYGYVLFGDGESTDSYRGQVFYKHDDDYMAIVTANSEAMRIDSAGNVGIGTASPSSTLHVNSGSDNLNAIFESTDTAVNVQFKDPTGIAEIESRNDFRFKTNAAERMRIDSAGNVGIGTASPSAKLEIDGDTNSTYLIMGGDDTSNGRGLRFTSSASAIFNGAVHTINAPSSQGVIALATSNTERARIDSSGNLLVGTTTANLYSDTTGQGIAFHGNGRADFKRDSASCAIFNRVGNDGEILLFHKSGASVGSIGNLSTSLYIGGDSQCGIMFNGANYNPTSSGSTRSDGTVTLGQSNYRFKDLYLSGGVYLGGTGAVNKLDDYEEGTWTPVLTRVSASTNATITLDGSAKYVKVGSSVTLTFYVSSISNFPTDGTSAVILGLPFTANQWASGSIAYGTATNCSYTNWTTNAGVGYFLNDNNNGFRNGTIDLSRGMFTITYTTDA